jgi:hypothetical protein
LSVVDQRAHCRVVGRQMPKMSLGRVAYFQSLY